MQPWVWQTWRVPLFKENFHSGYMSLLRSGYGGDKRYGRLHKYLRVYHTPHVPTGIPYSTDDNMEHIWQAVEFWICYGFIYGWELPVYSGHCTREELS